MTSERGPIREEEFASFIRSVAANRLMEGGVSRPRATALGMLQLGRDLVTSVGDSTGDSSNVAPDVASWFDGLDPEPKRKVAQGQGLIIVGSAVKAFEIGLVDGWDADVYFSTYNEHIRGVPLPPASAEVLLRVGGVSRSSEEETQALRTLAKNEDKEATFVPVLENTNNMPRIVATHIEHRSREVQRGVSEAVSLYSDVIKMLTSTLTTPTKTKEDKPGFVEKIDREFFS